MSASTACPACGTANASTNTFCVNCGARLGAAAATASGAPTVGPPPAAPPPMPPYPVAYPYYAPPFPRRASFSDMLSGLFDVWTKNFLPFFLVYLALGAATRVLSLVVSFAIFGSVYLGGGFGGLPPTSFPTLNFGLIFLDAIVTFVVSAILTSIVTGAMTEYAVRRHRGEPMTVEQAFRRGLARFPSILGANFLLGLILFGLVTIPLLLILVALVAGLSGSGGAVALLCGGAILFVVLGVLAIFLYVSLVLYAPAIMMENASAVDGLSRSWRMTRGHRWSLFGAIFVTGLLAGVIDLAISFPLFTLTSLTGDPIVSAFVSIVTSAFVSALVGSWIVILVAVAYELIVRRPTPYFGAAPPYVAGAGIAPPPGAAQTGPPPLSGPPPGP